MAGCPLADLPDYRNIVKRRLPDDCLLDSGEEEIFVTSEKMMNLEDANFIKELVADGLLVSFLLISKADVNFMGTYILKSEN